MSNFKILKVAILTDLHAYSSQTANPPSWICLANDQNNPTGSPFAGLKHIISADRLSADVVLCCGDIGDKADPQALQYAWKEIHDLKAALGAKLVLGTAGNHDLDSRFNNTSFDARGQIQALEPPFPVEDNNKWMEYWAKNFTSLDFDNARFVLLNSAAYHGYGKENSKGGNFSTDSRTTLPEYEHGRVSDRTIDRMIRDLTAEGERSANILVCHHHPYKNDQIKISDYSEMEGGERLINRLIETNFGPWLVIHGHKHMPRIFHAPGGNVSPTVFAAGSFSARLYPEYGNRARNDFYILELQVPNECGLVTSLRGAIRTWNWSYGNGWVTPSTAEGLGPQAAFGARVDLGPLASTIATQLKLNHAGSFVPWSEIGRYASEVDHLIPEDLKQLVIILKSKHNLKMLSDDDTGVLAQVQVPA